MPLLLYQLTQDTIAICRFSEIPKDKPTSSAPVIQHPTLVDEPAYTVKILQPAPSPLSTNPKSTPAASVSATPRSEPTPAERTLSVSEVTTLFLKSLLQSAEDFLGKKVDGTVISVPAYFDDAQRAALKKAAEDAGVTVLQLLDEAGAAAVATSDLSQPSATSEDRTQLIVDLGASSLELSLTSMREGLAYSLASSSDPMFGPGDLIDSKLIKFFAKEFTKKTKTPLTVSPASDPLDKRAEAKLLLAVEHTKRTLSASPGAATCSVESLKDGLDFTGSINRMRFDMEVRSIYNAVLDKAKELLSSAGLDLYDIDEIVYIGGSACLPGLDETLVGGGFREDVVTPFGAGTVVGGGAGDPTTILARGCALQAQIIASLGEDEAEVRKAFIERDSSLRNAISITKTIGVLFPEKQSGEGLGGQWISVLQKETAVPARRTVGFEVDLGEDNAKILGLEIWEVKEGIKIDKVKPPKLEYEDEEEEEEEDIEVKERVIEKETVLGSLSLVVKHTTKDSKGKWKTKVEVQFLVGIDGVVEVDVWELGHKGEKVSVKLGTP